MKYYYNEQGDFVYRSGNDIVKFDLPYIEKPEGWPYDDYKINVETGALTYDPKSRPAPSRR